ncbi:MAG: PRC-barrel domain-containing protein [Desulfobaccales bacterium]|jgi:sporulation protein YlmC with PRC-barrel domain
MSRKIVAVLICLAMVALVGTAVAQQKEPAKQPPQAQPQAQPQPPVAGVQPLVIGITVNEMVVVAKGWSVKKQILGKNVYNDKNQKIGKVDDLIIAPDSAISYGIIGAGGFLGVDRNDVAIPATQFKIETNKIILPGATKDAIKAMPKFEYAK